MKYTLSFDVKRTYYRIKPRPWWSIFGRDALEPYSQWERQVLVGLSHDQAQMIVKASEGAWMTTAGHLLVRLMARDGAVKNVDLRAEPGEPAYYVLSEGDAIRAGVSP